MDYQLCECFCECSKWAEEDDLCWDCVFNYHSDDDIIEDWEIES